MNHYFKRDVECTHIQIVKNDRSLLIERSCDVSYKIYVGPDNNYLNHLNR